MIRSHRSNRSNRHDRTDRHIHGTTTRRRRLPAALATAAASLAGSMTMLSGTASAAPLTPTALFDPPATAWVSLRNLTSAQFGARFDELSEKGYMVTDLEVDVIGADYRVGAVFQENPDGRGWYSLRDLTDAQFGAKWEELKDAGFRVVDQETYVVGGTRYFAGVWVQNKENVGWASYRGVTSAQFSEKFDEYKAKGFLPVDVEVYPVGSGLRYAAAWVQNTEGLSWKLRRGLDDATFSSTFETYKAEGLRMVDVESVRTGAGQRYAGIWVENRNGRRWVERRDMDATGYRNRWNQMRDEGYRLVDYEKYETAGGVRYAGIWRQNSDRPDWALRTWVDDEVKAELEEFDVPGISVAIAHQGKVVYQRGFGHQDVEANVRMHGGSVLRIASVSKAVAGVLLMRMLDRHPELDLDDPVREYLPLPEHHSYTVGQSASNRSCVESYPEPFDSSEFDQYDTAWAAVQAHMDEPLGCTPGQYLYSTHAYDVLGAVFEKLEGKPIGDIVREQITAASGADSLRPEIAGSPVKDQATLYDSDTNEAFDPDNLSSKVLGGGLQSTAPDLVRLGLSVLDGRIVDDTAREDMWTPPAGSYAYGWDVGTADDKTTRVVGKAGGQPGAKSYLRIYPDDDIVIAVLSNRWKGGHSASGLSKAIGEKMLAELG
ncbi:MAG TPA: serine hydrolase [Acidimicrobiales bacterium]|jgi:CubicO group peptidase (beta-lactamase class C family)|nr:serine hydrolase [Acidimicrobiales bacterium]